MPFKLKSIEDGHITFTHTEAAKIALYFSDQYCLVNAFNLALLSEVVYTPKLGDISKAFSNLSLNDHRRILSKSPSIAGPFQLPYTGRQEYFAANFKEVVSTNHLSTDTQGFHYNDGQNNVLVFRGTQELPDYVTDIVKTPKAPYPYLPTSIAGNVHEGFRDAFMAVKPQIQALFDKPENQKRPTIITGHSLGGALATLAAAFIAEKYREYPCGKVMVYTYGSPRVGDAKFVKYFTEMRPFIHFRHRHQNDLVPLVPPNHLDMRYSILPVVAELGGSIFTLPAAAVLFCVANSSDTADAFVHHGQGVLLRHVGEGNPYLIHGNAAYETVIADGKFFNSGGIALGRELIEAAFKSSVFDHSVRHYVEGLAHCFKETITAWKKDPAAVEKTAEEASHTLQLEIGNTQKKLLEPLPDAPASTTATAGSRPRITESERQAHLENTLAVLRDAKMKVALESTLFSSPDAKEYFLQSLLPGELTVYAEEELEYHLEHIK